MTREQASVRRRLRLLEDQARTDEVVPDKSRDAWVEDFISRLAGTLRNIATMRRREK